VSSKYPALNVENAFGLNQSKSLFSKFTMLFSTFKTKDYRLLVKNGQYGTDRIESLPMGDAKNPPISKTKPGFDPIQHVFPSKLIFNERNL